MNERFSRLSRWSAAGMGHPYAFGLALTGVALWLVAGPVFGFSDTWQLSINTVTTIITFLMVFLIQHTQNHQGDAVQIKLDELIRAMNGAHNYLLDLEDSSGEELRVLKEQYKRLHELAEQHRAKGESDVDSPEM
jgi:low affinity Fe/Cu permease